MRNIFILLITILCFSNTYAQTAEQYNSKGVAKEKLEDYRGAILDYTKAIEVNPKFAEAYCNRGVVKFYLKDFRGAILDYNKAIEVDPSFGAAYFNRGETKRLLGDIDGSCLDWSKAGEFGLSEAYDKIKEYCN